MNDDIVNYSADAGRGCFLLLDRVDKAPLRITNLTIRRAMSLIWVKTARGLPWLAGDDVNGEGEIHRCAARAFS